MIRENSIYTFYLYKNRELATHTYEYTMPFGEYILSYTKNTKVAAASNNEKEIILLGDITYLLTDIDDLANFLLNKVDTIETLIKEEFFCGGKYCIFIKINNEYYILGDATCSFPIVYTSNLERGDFSCSSNGHNIAADYQLDKDEVLNHIRQCSDLSQAMPYDYTVYKELRQLLPNHYIKVSEDKVENVRFINQFEECEKESAEKAARDTFPFIDKMAKFYTQNYEIICPLTGGKDSRVVFAFLKRYNPQLMAYTMQHGFHTGNEADLIIPPKLCAEFDSKHFLIKDVKPTEELIAEIDNELGESSYSYTALTNVNTVASVAQSRTIVNGDVVGQIGKACSNRDVPEVFLSSGYFRCKIHNYSKEAKRGIKEWMREVSKSGEKVSIYDLFFVESRLGRWAGNGSLVSNTFGQRTVNIFNSRSIIYKWTNVSRDDRCQSKIHFELLKMLDESYLNVEFEKDNTIKKVSKSTWVSYYIASFVKYYIDKIKFTRKRKFTNNIF